ncbi:hypothetical protein [Denitrobaculum tricleocarpae]|uniref:Uncharacterized protein n=1 Tax=Denitrobaculum tricleocarpae TaxID=2591009 RepID=A0A545TY12_9PROT|nr:hypothetical protein [Denitrobaculum tricleocarpae]TQV82099.1 hypothetical protein FKG95_07690 [Denitrobaculum tricleocarpae]
MASDGGDRYALGRLVLDYLKTFMWPVIALVVVILFQDDVRGILENREVELAGVVRIGPQIEQLQQQATEEIADIRALLQTQTERGGGADPEAAGQVTADIENKLTKLSSRLTRGVEQIQQTAPVVVRNQGVTPAAAQEERLQRVSALERHGFSALLDRDVQAAIKAFGEAVAIWPEYHNVSAVSDLLTTWENELSDAQSPKWSELYRTVLTDLSWGMPSDLRPEFRSLATKSY